MPAGRFLFVVLVVLCLAVCSTAAQAASAGEAKPKPVAVVNGSEISLEDFNRELYAAERVIINAGRLLSSPAVARLRTEVVENLVRQELLYQEAKKTVRVTGSEVTAEVEKLKGRFRTEADFAKAVPSLRSEVEKRLTIAKYVETAYTAKAQVTDEELRSSYERNRQALRQPEQVKALYVFVKVDPAWGEARKKEAKKKIEDIRRRALRGEDFTSLARTYSDDPTASTGGDLGYVRPGQLMQPLEKAVFALKAGEVSAVLEAGPGCHLFKATDHRAETTVSFEEVKDRLRTLLKQEKGQQTANAFIARVREKAKVEISLPREE